MEAQRARGVTANLLEEERPPDEVRPVADTIFLTTYYFKGPLLPVLIMAFHHFLTQII